MSEIKIGLANADAELVTDFVDMVNFASGHVVVFGKWYRVTKRFVWLHTLEEADTEDGQRTPLERN